MSRIPGLGYLIFAGVVGSVAGLTIFSPETTRGWIGMPTRPVDDGPAPTLTGDVQVSMETRDHEAAIQSPVRLAAPKVAAPVAALVTAPKPTEQPKFGVAADKAQEQLSEAERLYRSYQWNAAISAARKLADQNPPTAIRQRAKDIAALAFPVGQLFGQLNDRDELARNYDTNPSLVAISGGRDVTYAVPILSSDKDAQIVDKDPLGFIASQRKIGAVNFLVKGSKGYIAAPLSDDKIGTVTLVDQTVVRRDKSTQLESYRKQLVGPARLDPMAWYDIGRYAYQNRLDSQVVDALHQAMLLDPKLAQTVREDRAGLLFSHLVAHLKNGNKMQAATYMSIIDRKYKDTDQGRQARMYYDGRTSELLAAAKESQRKADEEEARRREELATRAKETNDQELAKAVAAAKPEPEPAPELPATITGSGDEASALALFEKGAKNCSDAIDKGNTPERDQLYGLAIKNLQQAVLLLSNLAEKEKDAKKLESLQSKIQEANQMKAGALKMRRPGH
jgi:hypothetical protein